MSTGTSFTTQLLMSLIFLIGYMGSGKTTLGHAVAAASGARFIDLDDYIEADAGTSISSIFATKGEPEFRRMESLALHSLIDQALSHTGQPTIVACGGGTPCQPGNMDLMNRSGITVWLDVAIPRLIERLTAERSRRPLVASLSDQELPLFITRALADREPFYSQASHRFDASLLDSTDQIEQSVDKFINLFLK